MCGSFLLRMQRRFLRSQFSNQRLDPFDGELVGHRRPYFLVVLDLFVELVACVAHPKVPRWQPTRAAADMTANLRIGSPYTSPSTRHSPLADVVSSRYPQASRSGKKWQT